MTVTEKSVTVRQGSNRLIDPVPVSNDLTCHP